MKGNRHTKHSPGGMFQDVMTAGNVMNKKPGPLECPDYLFGFDDRKSLLHGGEVYIKRLFGDG
jgi:hypothetical protein